VNAATALADGLAPANVRSSDMLRFGRFELDPINCRLLREGCKVALKPRTFELLLYLAQNPGRLIRKEELLEHVWSAQILSDSVLSNTVAQLRKARGQGAHAREPIETLYGRGYRFHALVETATPAAAVETQPSTQLGAVRWSRLCTYAAGRAAGELPSGSRSAADDRGRGRHRQVAHVGHAG
jgi:DNA-binding winged helix-turn-helix (wHTH) protein